MTPTVILMLVAIVIAVAVAVFIVVAGARAKAREVPIEPLRHINKACAAGGHAYQVFGTGYRCATCGNHISSSEGELYGRVEDGRQDRRREPR
jgi:hypothetical protein